MSEYFIDWGREDASAHEFETSLGKRAKVHLTKHTIKRTIYSNGVIRLYSSPHYNLYSITTCNTTLDFQKHLYLTRQRNGRAYKDWLSHSRGSLFVSYSLYPASMTFLAILFKASPTSAYLHGICWVKVYFITRSPWSSRSHVNTSYGGVHL